jgi:hypothetical protein
MKVGDLIKWTHYGIGNHTIHYGLFLRKVSQQDLLLHNDWGNIWVWAENGEERWVSWQCKVISSQDGITLEEV